jgi:hypothetical protein
LWFCTALHCRTLSSAAQCALCELTSLGQVGVHCPSKLAAPPDDSSADVRQQLSVVTADSSLLSARDAHDRCALDFDPFSSPDVWSASSGVWSVRPASASVASRRASFPVVRRSSGAQRTTATALATDATQHGTGARDGVAAAAAAARSATNDTSLARRWRVMAENDEVLHLGIVDYLVKYNWKKQLEAGVKSMYVKEGESISCVPPAAYASRLADFMRDVITAR